MYSFVIICLIYLVFTSAAVGQVSDDPDRQIFVTDPDNCVSVEKRDAWRIDDKRFSEDALDVQFKLANRCRRDVFYLSEFDRIDAYGFLIYGNNGVWKGATPAWGRKGSITGSDIRWRRLRPGETVCSNFGVSIIGGQEASVALYYSYSETPAQEAIIEVLAPPFPLGPEMRSLPKRKLGQISDATHTCVAEPNVGYLLGSINRFNSAEYRPGVTIVLGRNRYELPFTSDGYGEFSLKLPVGKYRLIKVFDKDGKPLRTKKKRNGFEIREGSVTKWDLELRIVSESATRLSVGVRTGVLFLGAND